eukprot:scaffold103210_cov61-Phaeocystis_antarctica.AAC.2
MAFASGWHRADAAPVEGRARYQVGTFDPSRRLVLLVVRRDRLRVCFAPPGMCELLGSRGVAGLCRSSPHLYPEVRRRHVPELSGLLIELATSVCKSDPHRDAKISSFLRPLVGIMAQPGTPLDTLWLAPRVSLLVKKHMKFNGFFGGSYETRCFGVHRTQIVLLDLVGFLEPHVLRSDPETYTWLKNTLQILPKTRLTASGGIFTVENGLVNDTMWNTGLVAWNERCEAQRLPCSCGAPAMKGTMRISKQSWTNRFVDVLSVAVGQMLSSCSQIRPPILNHWARLLPGARAMTRGGRSRATTSSMRSITTAQ